MNQTQRQVSEISRPKFWSGLVAISLGAVASAFLIAGHFMGVGLPGCGVGSPCDAIAKSAFGTIPGIGWPTSFLGGAYFAGVLVAWVAGAGRAGRSLTWVVRVGAFVSVLLLGVLFFHRQFCAYCVAAHVGNLVLWFLVERSQARTKRTDWQPLAGTLAGVVVLAVLGVGESSTQSAAKQTAASNLAASTKAIVEAVKSTPEPAEPDKPRFEGRYRWGPENASVRVVMFTGYQCPDCAMIERQLEPLMKSGLDLAVSIKHFPLSTDCNENAPGRHHENACWAARAAEAAGMLGGVDGFWKMHRWLFARAGAFTEPELNAGLAELGLDHDRFLRLMESQDTLNRVQADVKEAMSLGIQSTPMIFINGVELRGWNVPQALDKAVRAAAAAAPKATAESDHPISGAERMVADWREQRAVTFPPDILRHGMGPADSPITVVMFGDYQEPFTGEADGVLRLFTSGPKPNIRYYFVNFPVNQACNPSSQITLHPLACLAHKAAEAADVLGGPTDFWKMHEWLMMNRATLSEQTLRDACPGMGIDADALFEAMDQPFVGDRIVQDASVGTLVGIRSIPMIFVNGKHVARWKAQAENILPRIFNELSGIPAPDAAPQSSSSGTR